MLFVCCTVVTNHARFFSEAPTGEDAVEIRIKVTKNGVAVKVANGIADGVGTRKRSSGPTLGRDRRPSRDRGGGQYRQVDLKMFILKIVHGRPLFVRRDELSPWENLASGSKLVFPRQTPATVQPPKRTKADEARRR